MNTEVTLKISSNVVEVSNDENNFPHRLFLTNSQVLKFCKTFENGSLANVKLSKTQLQKIRKLGELLRRRLGPLLKTGLPLVGNELKPLAKSVLIPLRSTATTSATGATIHKKMFGSGTTTLIIFNEELNDLMKIINYLEKSGLLKKSVIETIKN